MKTTILALTAIVALSAPYSRAAQAPQSKQDMQKEADLVVSGHVTEITSKVQKSTVETSKGIHRDRIYTITIKLTKVAKGNLKVGKTIVVKAWAPVKRVPPLPGLQGHSNIPKKGQTVTLYLKKDGKLYEPILPNGIVIDDSDE